MQLIWKYSISNVSLHGRQLRTHSQACKSEDRSGLYRQAAYDLQWLILLKMDTSQAWVFWVTHSATSHQCYHAEPVWGDGSCLHCRCSVVKRSVSHCTQLLGTGLMAWLFVESWITILPWPLLAGLMRTLQLKHWQVRSMVNLSVGTNRQTLKLIQNEQTASGTRTAIRNTRVSSSGLFPWNAATKAIRLWPSDHLLNWKQNFRWQWAVWVYDQDLGDCFPRTWNRPSEWISTSFVQLHTAKFLECNPLGLLCSLSVIFLSPSKGCSFSMRTGLGKTCSPGERIPWLPKDSRYDMEGNRAFSEATMNVSHPNAATSLRSP